MDGRRNNGGHKTAGRKPKSDEQKLIEALSPMEKDANKALHQAILMSEGWAVKLWYEYMYGKPKQRMEIVTGEDKVLPDYFKSAQRDE